MSHSKPRQSSFLPHVLTRQIRIARQTSLPRRLASAALAVLLAVGLVVPVGMPSAFAVTSAEKQAEADATATKLNEWQDELDRASDSYFAALAAHEDALVKMDEAQGRIDAAQSVISYTQERLNVRASSMYKSGPLTFLDVLFGATSFEDFSSRWDLLNSINRDDAELIAQNKAAKHEAEVAHAEYSRQEQIAAEKLAEAEGIKTNAERLVAEYQAELSSLEAEVAELVAQEQEAQRQREAAAAAAAEAARQQQGGSPGQRGDGVPGFGGGTYDIIIQAAYSKLGSPYVWAAEGPNVFDCSGLTTWCYRQAGISIPHQSEWQRNAASSLLPPSQAQPGDVLWKSGHVGLYVGNGMFIDASPGIGVRLASMSTYNWTLACRF
ncbi:MAG: C40 family peptidase [Coriobacteriales bacterium]|jgi:cell wall-associated NlpC family hydrolase|nr:C40 family peptidase [Coriobacteriales bacterium]